MELKHLKLNGNKLGDWAISQLADLLQSSDTKLTKLDISCNNLTG